MPRRHFTTDDDLDSPDDDGWDDDLDLGDAYDRVKEPVQRLEKALAATIDLDDPDLPARPEHVPATPADMEDTSEPWGRRDDETDRQWEQFQKYLSLPLSKRSFAEVARQFGIRVSAIKEVAYKHEWKLRAAYWDERQQRLYEIERAEAVREMGKRHADNIVEILDLLNLPFQALRRKLQDEGEDVLEELAEMSVPQLAGLVRTFGRLVPPMMAAERLTRGLPTQEIHHSGDVVVRTELTIDPLATVLSTLDHTGVLDPAALPSSVEGEAGEVDAGATGGGQEIVDAEVVEVHSDAAGAETDRLPPS